MRNHDHWGLIYNMTGYEKVGCCYWCGGEAKKTRSFFQRYCCKQHRHLYLVHFRWSFARGNVYRRIRNQHGDCVCEKCNKAFKSKIIEVHHIDQVNGESRFMSQKNRPENLLGLCHNCHKETHRNLVNFQNTQKVLEAKKISLEIQPELF